MTTTPTASPELPDLDKLEALARAATPGPWAYQEDSDAYTHIVRPAQSPGRIVHHYSQDTSGVVEANARFTAGANPAAVLALIALARRAQPASEATQTACTVPPEGWYCTRAPGHDGPCAAWPVAQQDAAPSNSPEIPDGSTSSPGTPEAPAEDRKGIELWRATLRACGELPEGYEVRIELENGCGMAVWYDAEGERHVIDGEGYLSDDVNEAVDAAIERAAQLDGGQEGSGSND